MSNLIHIADRVLNTPLLVTKDKAQVILSVLAGRIGVNMPDASRFEGSDLEADENGRLRAKPYRVSSGVGIITITGSLVNRGAWIGPSSGLTSYEGIGHQVTTAKEDNSVHAVILDMHTPGGEAVGAFEKAALVRDLAAKKRTIALVNGMACSAAYAIASGATEIVTTETGISGSIGVVLLHADISRQLDREGITPTLIHAGSHKVDGNPFEPLTADVRDDLQAEVNGFYEAFLATVAEGRGNRLTAAAARATEARSMMGEDAVAAGLADRVGTFESVLAELSRARGRSTVQNRRTSMHNNDLPAAEDNAGITQAAYDAGVAAARSEGAKAGATAEKERSKAVRSSEHYAGREAAAHHMLDTTEMSAEAITGVLAGLSAGPAIVSGDRATTSSLGLALGSDAGKTSPKSNNYGWDDVIAEVNQSNKH